LYLFRVGKHVVWLLKIKVRILTKVLFFYVFPCTKPQSDDVRCDKVIEYYLTPISNV